MIRIKRRRAPNGHNQRAQAALAGLTAVAALNGGAPSRSDLKNTYKEPEVRQALCTMQHGKCAYCERQIEVAWEPVEHYRPFAKYWWLAYDWKNLLAACNNCNSGAKKDQFPLADERKRLVAHQPPPGLEQPLVLDPSSVDPTTDPELHLTFVEEPNGKWCIAPKNGSRQGKKTIEICKLGRSHLNELRNSGVAHLVDIRRRFEQALQAGDVALLATCRGDKARLTADNQPFALLARVILADVV